MIDHLIRFSDEAAAQADPVVNAYWSEEGGWRGDVCVPDVKVWQPADDVIGEDEDGNETRAPQYLPYWYLIVALPALGPDLTAHPTCMLVADRDAAVLDEPFVLHSLIAPENLNSYALAPVFAGSVYPFGSV